MNEKTTSDAIRRAEEVLGKQALNWRSVRGGYTLAQKYVVAFADGTSAFVKMAADEETAGWLRSEHKIYATLEANFLPRLIAWQDADLPLLILENLEAAHWPPPWPENGITLINNLLRELQAVTPPPNLPSMTTMAKELVCWEQIALEPSLFLGLGLASSQWLADALPALRKAEKEITLTGDTLVHTDIRSDNICFARNQTLLLDWNWACIGNPKFDEVYFFGTLYAETGKEPWHLSKIEEPGLVVALAGFYASHAGLPAPKEGATIRNLQKNLARAFLTWSAHLLRLPQINLSELSKHGGE